MMDLNTFISQCLAPAVAISGIGMITLTLSNRMSTIGTRIRQLNREMTGVPHPEDAKNLRCQVENFLRRARIIRNAIFLLHAAIGLMVLTAFGIAAQELHILEQPQAFSIATFLGGLLLTFIAVLMEAYEVGLNLQNLKLDIELAYRTLDRNGQG